METRLTRMSLCVLGSGSGGNCSVLVLRGRTRRHVFLIDLGLSQRQTKLRLSRVGVDLDEVEGAFITHFDHDHFHKGWVKGARERGIRLYFHLDHHGWANRCGAFEVESYPFDGEFCPAPGCRVRPVRLAHDGDGTVGFRIESGAGALGFATDLGRVPADLLAAFTGLEAVAIESNYCPRMQLASSRPSFLKHRIMGGKGHLSNEEALEAVRAIRAGSSLRHVVLLHVSRQCNDPALIRRMWAAEPELARMLVISDQQQPTRWIELGDRPEVHVQPGLFDGMAMEALTPAGFARRARRAAV